VEGGGDEKPFRWKGRYIQRAGGTLGRGLLCVLSSPSGGGKTTVIREVLKRRPEYRYSISSTTRPRRPGEVNGKDYFFLTEREFRTKIAKGEFAEWAEVHGYLYGTSRRFIDGCLKKGQVVLLDLDVQGGLAVKRLYGNHSLLIFLKPPSLEVLVNRLKGRKTESEAEIKRRIQRIPEEMAKAPFYDFVLVNDKLEATVEKIIGLIEKHRERSTEVKGND